MGEDCGSILISIPAARSCAAILSRSRTRKFTIQTFWASPKYLLVSGKGAKTVGPASCSQTGSPSLDGVSEIPRCCWYQLPNAFRIFGSEEESSDSRHFFHFHSSSDPIANSGPRRGRRELWRDGCLRR